MGAPSFGATRNMKNITSTVTVSFLNKILASKHTDFEVVEIEEEHITERGDEYIVACSDGIARCLIAHYSSLGIRYVWSEDFEEYLEQWRVESRCPKK